MKKRIGPVVVSLGLLVGEMTAQTVTFDFDSAPLHSPLPLDLTVGGITAHFSATGQGYSIQEAGTMGFTPAGFFGYCIYPSSVFAADLLVGFSGILNSFSILYAPQELACDSSATMRVTAYMNDTQVGTSTTVADPPGTWPTATLAISSPQGFNRVVVHYDAPPPTGGDWGPIFMADNMQVTPAVVLANATTLPGGAFHFTFTATPGAAFTVLGTTNVTLPFANWTVLGPATENSAGQFEFTDTQTAGSARRFYRVRSP
jgi:hypothetical protein